MKKAVSIWSALLLISLLAINRASSASPQINCPLAATVECGDVTTLTADVSDADGDALVAVWMLNGVMIQTNQIAAGSPQTIASISFVGSLPLGTNELAIGVTDTSSNSTSCTSTIVVVDTTPPVIESVSATPKNLWPPNHKLLPVIVKAVVSDACGSTTWKIVSVTSNESENGLGDGNTPTDWVIIGDHKLKLRSERSGNGDGRIYTITIQATDESGNVSEPATVDVMVAHDQRNHNGKNHGNGHGNVAGHGNGKNHP